MEAILQQLIMKHSLRIRINFESSSLPKGSMGKLMNLTSDMANMTAMVDAWPVCEFQHIFTSFLSYNG